jgi:predicted deacylase
MLNDKLKNYSYAKLIFELIHLCRQHKFEIKLIGNEKFKYINSTYPIYRFTIHPKANIKFGIITGMHGDEIAGPLSIFYLLKNPKKYFNKKICYHIYPVISPTAFDLKRRYDDDNIELNTLNKRTLKNYKYHEIECLYEDLKNKKLNTILSLHEDVDQTNFYMYINRENNQVYKKIISNANKHVNILKKKIIDKRVTNKKGFIIGGYDETVEDWLFLKKKPDLCVTTETPGMVDLNTRIAINLHNIQLLNHSSLN